MIWNYFLILLSLTLNSANVYARYKLPVTVYYESKCKDSTNFIVEQLEPAVKMLHNYLRVKLIPFGKAKSLDDGFRGFSCQHGPSECFGNIIQDCVLDLMVNRTDEEKVAYVACEMKTHAATVGNMRCADAANISYDPVMQCVTGNKGTMLQLDSEYQTSLVELNFVPTVTIGGIFNQQIQDYSLIDLIGTLCSFLKEQPPCARYYNNLALKKVMNRAVPDRGYEP